MVLGGESEAERGRRVHDIIRGCIRRRVAGETLPDEQVASDHPDLMPELGEELRALALIQEAEQRASDSVNHANDTSADVSLPTDSFPGYEITREIHRGGQGVVYEALQKSTQRKVAIKAMREGPFGRPGDRTRFEREVQILGQLKHPHIVTIHDSGSAVGGFYFVMDYIVGTALDEFIAGQNRSIPETLELFARVCDAVNAAHLHGIIHRDLKPSNIRVDPQEDPHILDFGLAKIATGENERSGMTLTGQFVGSVPWASPEQAEGMPQKIDMRTDVYSLGMILYHMLTGRFPYGVTGNIRDVVDNILKAEPTRPSTIRKRIDDEVETIVLKCLSKDPDRRYQTAGELVRDIRRYLAGEPIEAKRDSVGYVLRKHLRRYRLPVAIAGAFALVVTVGFLTSLIFWRDAVDERNAAEASRAEAERQAAIAQAVNDFLNEDLLASADPYNAPNREISVREALDAAADAIEDRFQNEPLVEAAIRVTLGSTYRSLGKFDVAEPHLGKALTLLREVRGPEHPDTLAVIDKLATLYCKQARFDDAEPLLVQNLEACRRVLGSDHKTTLLSMGNLAMFYQDRGRYEEAERLYATTVETQRRVLGPEHPDTLLSMNNLAGLYNRQGRYNEAESLYRSVLAAGRRVLGQEHPFVAINLNNLASLLRHQGKLPEAEALHREALAMRRRLFGEEHPGVATSLNNLALVLKDRGDYAAAESLFREALALRRGLLGEEHSAIANSLNNLALVLKRQGDLAAAEPLYREALAMRRKLLGNEHPRVATSLKNLAQVLCDKGEPGSAEPLFQEALAIYRAALGDEHPFVAGALNALAMVYKKQGRYGEAEPLYRESLAMCRKLYGNEHPQLIPHLVNLGILLDDKGEHAAAESLLAEALAVGRKVYGEEHPNTLICMHRLADVYWQQRRLAEAEHLYRQAFEGRRRILGADHRDTLPAQYCLAETLMGLNKFDEAELLARELLTLRRADPQVPPATMAMSLCLLAEILLHNAKPEEAEPLVRECLEIRRASEADDDRLIANTESLLGGCLTALGHYEEAESLLLGSYPRIEVTGEEPDDLTGTACQRIIDLYHAWGDLEKANEWRVKLPGTTKSQDTGKVTFIQDSAED